MRTRKLILSTTYNRISNKGLFHTNMADLAEQSGITRRSLYNYYDSLEMISLDLQKMTLDHLEKRILACKIEESSNEKIFDFFSCFLQILQSDKKLMHFLLSTEHYYFGRNTGVPILLLSDFLKSSPFLATLESSKDLLVEAIMTYLEKVSFQNSFVLKKALHSYRNQDRFLKNTLLGVS